MRTLKTAFVLMFVSAFLTSCQKEVDFNLPPSVTPTPGTGGNGGGTTGSGAYFPLTTGSFWKYRDSASGVISTNTVVAATRAINNILYKGIKATGVPDTGWAAAPQPNYYLSQKGISPNTGASYDLTFHYLNDTAAVGATWQSVAGQGNGFAATVNTTVIERGITMTVSGRSYSNVIHTRVGLSYDLLGNVMQFGTYEYFIARGVGIIKIQSDLGGFGASFKACSDLVDHKIN
jgi:hypothetical protein